MRRTLLCSAVALILIACIFLAQTAVAVGIRLRKQYLRDGGGPGSPPARKSRYGTNVVLLRGYHSDLGGISGGNYVQPMALVLMMVVLAFGLLYVAVIAEERQMQEATKPRKR